MPEYPEDAAKIGQGLGASSRRARPDRFVDLGGAGRFRSATRAACRLRRICEKRDKRAPAPPGRRRYRGHHPRGFFASAGAVLFVRAAGEPIEVAPARRGPRCRSDSRRHKSTTTVAERGRLSRGPRQPRWRGRKGHNYSAIVLRHDRPSSNWIAGILSPRSERSKRLRDHLGTPGSARVSHVAAGGNTGLVAVTEEVAPWNRLNLACRVRLHSTSPRRVVGGPNVASTRLSH
jgi:hypothetical protein